MTLPQQLLSRCPSCYRNFVNLYCYFTCDPEQSDYVYAIKPFTEKNGITAVNYTVSHDFAYGLFNSCRDVQMPSANEKALGILCGEDASTCTPERWLHYMGDKNNHQTPFAIGFIVSNNKTTIDNTTLTPMNQTIGPCKGSCSCQDCQDSCGVPLPPIKPEPPCKILEVECGVFIGGSLYIVFAMVFGTYLIWHYLFCNYTEPQATEQNKPGEGISRSDQETAPRRVRFASPNCLERLGAKLELKFNRAFSAWGRFCARHPVIVLVVALVVSVILICGIAMFKVTTDPVDLWSSPDSRARQEKKKFEDNFT